MNLLQFTVPPLPHYFASGYSIHRIGERHVSRKNIGDFDLLFVIKGCLFIGEEDRLYDVSSGHAAILRPDCYHYGNADCVEDTEYFWLHFQTTGSWRPLSSTDNEAQSSLHPEPGSLETRSTQTFPLILPQFAKIAHPGKMEEAIFRLIDLGPISHLSSARFEQQVLFQEVIGLLAESLEPHRYSPGRACAEQAAAYLRQHYRQEITAKEMGDSLSFHPVYIARCMHQEYGCSPMEYLLRYRVEQSKLLLLQTDLAIARIAEEVGFNQAAYFSSCFARVSGMSPRKYRQQYFNG